MSLAGSEILVRIYVLANSKRFFGAGIIVIVICIVQFPLARVPDPRNSNLISSPGL